MKVEWDDSLLVGLEFMDKDHEDSVAHMNEVVNATGEASSAAFASFADHLAEHFAREEEAMERVGFFAYGCHKGEHDRVLAEVAEVRKEVEAGNAEAGRKYVAGTAIPWFLNHRDTMDTVTAKFVNANS